jgi:hypothetical protein
MSSRILEQMLCFLRGERAGDGRCVVVSTGKELFSKGVIIGYWRGGVVGRCVVLPNVRQGEDSVVLTRHQRTLSDLCMGQRVNIEHG